MLEVTGALCRDLGEAAEDEDESFLGEVVLNVAKLIPYKDRLIEQVT